MGPPGRSELGRSTRAPPGLGAFPVPRGQGMSHGRPGARGAELAGRDSAEDACLHAPARCGCSPDLAPNPRDRLREAHRSPSLPGGGHGGVTSSRLRRRGNRGEGGGGVGRGPCGARNRPPGAAAPPGHYNNGALSNPKPRRASRARGCARAAKSRTSATWQGGRRGIRCRHTSKPTFANT